MNKLLELRPDSKQLGLCMTCIHLVDGRCDTCKPCGQIMACRCQAKAVIVGRYSSGRVRKAPLKRVKKVKLPKVSAWKLTHDKLAEIGDNCDCVWIGFLSDSTQTKIRRLIKRGSILVNYVGDVMLRKCSAIFISVKDLDDKIKNWRLNYVK